MITNQIIHKLTYEAKDLFDFYDKKKLRKTAKQKSEDISGLLETVMEDLIDGAIAPKLDKEPDIILNGKPIEIKTTNGNSWRGGELSKRGGYFIFVSWKPLNKNFNSFFIAGLPLKKEDWIITKSKNYYATYYNKKLLFQNKDKVDFYCGRLSSHYRGKQLCIPIIYENPSLLK